MFNALNGLGAGGQFDEHANDASNSALYATFAIVGFFAGTVTNALGINEVVTVDMLFVYNASLAGALWNRARSR